MDDVSTVLENVCSQSLEWSVPMWFASLHLRKAFDRVEYNALFDALKRARGSICIFQTYTLHGTQDFHKCFGKKSSADPRKRAMVDMQHRSRIAS